jgi:hypothetical protein
MKRTAEQAELKDEPVAGKKPKLAEITEKLWAIQKKERVAETKRDAEIKSHHEVFWKMRTEIMDKFKPELEELQKLKTALTLEKKAEEALETAREIIAAAKENPTYVYLFDHRKWEDEAFADAAKKLLDQELGGCIEIEGYWGLQATEEQIACNWSYSSLEWMANKDDYWYSCRGDTEHILDFGEGSEATFYIDEAPKDEKTGEELSEWLDTKFIHKDGVEWDEDEVPREQDIEWETDKSCVTVYGRVWGTIAAFTMRPCEDKALFNSD